ncbi:putative phage abortive infection protein [Pseudomonas plecoglossicida]|uniref:putative phage abortive infection protein n=1 Tax=Pseudomonas plecoglossicida TaxID=70775 RepID=UPI0015E2E36B|nr:putative phage abortive infection protein [Pseudomonas plecoglossicida]MBA1321229.1 hypothetical protein [Pseudomonas plecoglossicida]
MKDQIPAEKPSDKDFRNMEDVWQVYSKEDLEKIKARIRLAWGAIRRSYILILVLIAVVPIALVALAVVVHFQFGADIPWLAVRNAKTAEHWGQIGDFVGGVLNPVLSFFAFLAVLINLILQRQDLALARTEAREAYENQKAQSLIFEKQNENVEKQNFEATFFRLLDVHSQQSITASLIPKHEGNRLVGAECFAWISDNMFPTKTYGAKPVIVVLDKVKTFAAEYSSAMARYFLNLHQILKYIDSYGDKGGLRQAAYPKMKVLRSIRYYSEQRVYANILRAQLSSGEQCAIFINCLNPRWSDLKYYVEKFSLLKGVDFKEIYSGGDVRNLYQSIAYADSENISRDDLSRVVSQKYNRE